VNFKNDKALYYAIFSIFILLFLGPKSLTLREEHRLRLFEDKVRGRMFRPKRDEITGGWNENCIVRSFLTCALHQI
jgi:hypothetical protein